MPIDKQTAREIGEWTEIGTGETNGVRWRLERRENSGVHPSELRVTCPPGGFPVAIVNANHADVVAAALAHGPKPAKEIVGYRVSARYEGMPREYARKDAIDFTADDRKDAHVWTDRDEAVAHLREWKTYGGWHSARLHPVTKRTQVSR